MGQKAGVFRNCPFKFNCLVLQWPTDMGIVTMTKISFTDFYGIATFRFGISV